MINSNNSTLGQNFLKLAINKSILKEYKTSKSDRTVYLSNGSEFQLQLFNPLTFNICAEIYINGEKIPNSLVIKPGQRVWLERYLDRAKKFLYETYEVENGNSAVEAAIKNNGLIKVKFYREDVNKNTYKSYTIYTDKSINTINTTYTNDFLNLDSYNDCCTTSDYPSAYTSVSTADCTAKSFCQPTVSTVLYNSCDMITEPLLSGSINSVHTSYTSATTEDITADTVSTINYNIRDTKETGRIQEGSKSNQLLHNCDMEFSNWSFKTEIIQILPESEKPYTASDLQKQYCPECGRKLNTKYKFCPYCGTKIE